MLRQAANIGAVFLALVFTGVLVAWPLGLSGMLDDRPDLLAALLLGLAVFAFAELGRGILSGRHLFTEYGRYFAAEGISRMLIAGALVIVGIEMVGAYAITLAAAFLLGTLAAGFTVRPFVNPGPPSHSTSSPQLSACCSPPRSRRPFFSMLGLLRSPSSGTNSVRRRQGSSSMA